MPAKDATAGSGFAAARAQLSKAVSSSKGENASAKRTFDDDLSDPSLEVIPRSTENRTLRLAFSDDMQAFLPAEESTDAVGGVLRMLFPDAAAATVSLLRGHPLTSAAGVALLLVAIDSSVEGFTDDEPYLVRLGSTAAVRADWPHAQCA